MKDELVNEHASSVGPRAAKKYKSGGISGRLKQVAIDALPDVVLQHCFSFIGNGHYQYIPGTCHHFNEIYSVKHEKKMTWEERAVASVSSAKLLSPRREKGGRRAS
jgi:hypothetical protein